MDEGHICEITVLSTRDTFYHVGCRFTTYCPWYRVLGPAPEPQFDVKRLRADAVQAERDHVRISHPDASEVD